MSVLIIYLFFLNNLLVSIKFDEIFAGGIKVYHNFYT